MKGADVVESETKIVNLADAPEFLEEVSRWLWLEWAKADGYTLEEIVYRTKYASQKDTVPQTLVAVRDGKPVGVVSLWLNCLLYTSGSGCPSGSGYLVHTRTAPAPGA